MAKTSNGMSGAAAKIEVTTDGGTTWVDVSGHTNKVDVPSQSRKIGETYVHGDDTAVLAAGPREPVDVTATIVYTEQTTDAFEKMRAIHETAYGGAVQIRWSPAGGATGDKQYTASGLLGAFQYPPTDASQAEVIVTTFVVRAASISSATVA